jgi:hypothetical protein
VNASSTPQQKTEILIFRQFNVGIEEKLCRDSGCVISDSAFESRNTPPPFPYSKQERQLFERVIRDASDMEGSCE